MFAEMNEKTKRIIGIIALCLIPFSLWDAVSLVFYILSMLFSGLSLVMVLKKEPGPDKSIGMIRTIYVLLLTMLFLLHSAFPINLFAYTLSLAGFYITYTEKKLDALLIGPYSVMVVAFIFGSNELYSTTTTIGFLFLTFAVFALMSPLIGAKATTISFGTIIGLLRVATVFYRKTRFAYIGIHDLISAGTFTEVISQYNFRFNEAMMFYIILGLAALVPVIFMHDYKPKKRWWLFIVSAIGIVASILYIGYDKKISMETLGNRSMNQIASIPLSIVEDIEFYRAKPDVEKLKKEVKAFVSDPSDMNVNIVCVMCESLADVTTGKRLTPERDPLMCLKDIEDEGFQWGKVRASVFGGGTSRSEWEFLTGIPTGKISAYRNPFILDCNSDYTFTSDASGMYSDYTRTLLHPFYSNGWNRADVYDAFGYDNKIFIENWGDIPEDDTVRNYLSDKAFCDRVIETIENNDAQQFIMGVTMQNHSPYDTYESDSLISLAGDIEENGEDDAIALRLNAEKYLTLTELTAEAIRGLIDYLKVHPEEPTMLIVFGDHWPSEAGVYSLNSEEDVLETGDVDKYLTPYFVYSNFRRLDEMPEEIPIANLFPNAKKAAGLPLTSWEKYILSLDGQSVSKDMGIARIKNGYF